MSVSPIFGRNAYVGMEWIGNSLTAISFLHTKLSNKGIDEISFKDLLLIPLLPN